MVWSILGKWENVFSFPPSSSGLSKAQRRRQKETRKKLYPVIFLFIVNGKERSDMVA